MVVPGVPDVEPAPAFDDPAWAPAPAPLALDPRELDVINRLAVGLAAGVVLATLLGLLWDRRRGTGRDGRPGCWAIALLVCSYAILVPGLFTTLISLEIGAMESMSLKKMTDSTIEFIHTLSSTGGWLGAILVVLFAFVIPLVKVAFLVLGEIWRHSSERAKVRRARMCIASVKHLSKWACPDMFAYILLWYLVRSLHHPPTLLGLVRLGPGFTCYSIFCVGSAVASLGIPLPALADEDQKATQPEAPHVLQCIGRSGAVLLVVGLAVAFAALIHASMVVPCLALRLDIDGLIAGGYIDESLRDFVVEDLKLPLLASADVTVWQCIRRLAGDGNSLDANNIIALIMLTVFVLGLTVLDMAMLVVAAFQRLSGSGGCGCQAKRRAPRNVWAVAGVLKKLSMLDVMVAGIVIIVLSGDMYKSQGLILSFRGGALALAAAELCHYGAYYTVMCLEAPPAAPAAPDAGAAEAGAPVQRAASDCESH